MREGPLRNKSYEFALFPFLISLFTSVSPRYALAEADERGSESEE